MISEQRHGLHPSMGETTIYTLSNTFSLLWVFQKNMRDCGELLFEVRPKGVRFVIAKFAPQRKSTETRLGL
jgi:hypothetical protein